MKRIFWSFFCFLLLTVVILNFAFSPLVSKAIDHYLQNQINAYYRSLVKGLFYMVTTDLNRHTKDQWTDRISTIAPNFGFPITIQKIADIDLDATDQQQLSENLIVVQWDGDMFYQKVGQTDWVISLGPVEDLEADLVWLEVIIWAGLIVVIGLLTFAWAMPFGRKLHKISTAALAFGDGRLEVRAEVPRRSALTPLADAFNRMADRIQQLINTQKELTYAVSHELRTPISRIRFSLEILDGAAKPADRKHYLSEITKDVDELDDLVTESLTYARFEHSTPQMQWQARVLEPWLQHIALCALKGHRHIKLHIRNCLSKPDREVYLEPRYMQRAIGNLIQNAVNHTKSQVEITLAENGEVCLIHVDDNGPGIAEADRHRIFQAFTRLDASRSRKSGGYGLGLAIVHRVVTWHGGSVRVSESSLGGARLTISWPGFSTPAPQTNG
jgi:signal transduction histidine kinase